MGLWGYIGGLGWRGLGGYIGGLGCRGYVEGLVGGRSTGALARAGLGLGDVERLTGRLRLGGLNRKFYYNSQFCKLISPPRIEHRQFRNRAKLI